MISRDKKTSWQKTQWGFYRVRFYCSDGQRRSKVCKSKTDRDCLIAAIKRGEALDYWFPPAVSDLRIEAVGTFNALAEKWLDHSKKVREISESCLNNYRGHLRLHILPVIGSMHLKDLQLKSIEDVAGAIREKMPRTRSYKAVRKARVDRDLIEDDGFLAASYRREILTVGCMVTKFGFERGFFSQNPFEKFKLPECPEQPYDYWRLDEESFFLDWLERGGPFTKVVAHPGSKKKGRPTYYSRRFQMRPGKAQDLYDLVLFALRSGMRKGEIGALTRRDVNLVKNCVLVRRSYSEKEKCIKNTTKGKTFRMIEMNGDMREILGRHAAKAGSDSDLLFNTSCWSVKNFSKYCAKAGVREIHFHSLRHTCLTNLANGYGMDKPLSLPEVQAIAGHREISTTMRYVHTNGIENTSSRQWTRRERLDRVRSSEPDLAEGHPTGLRLISGGCSVGGLIPVLGV